MAKTFTAIIVGNKRTILSPYVSACFSSCPRGLVRDLLVLVQSLFGLGLSVSGSGAAGGGGPVEGFLDKVGLVDWEASELD